MLYTLSILDPTSLPVSQLLSAEQLCALDQFAVERKEEARGRSPILLEQYRTEASEILDGVLLELGATNVPEVVYNEMLVGVGEYLHSNFKVSYDALSSRLLDDISAALGFNTMAYRDAWQHARITHTHPDDYSHLRCKAVYTKEQVVAMGAEDKEDFTEMSNWLGTVVIWQQVGKKYLPISTDIFMPNFIFEEFPEPNIGEVRFIGWKSFPTGSSSPYKEETIGGTEMIYDSENLGYWVYPHGQRINCGASEFKAARRAYAGSETATQFTVPDLRDFIRLNPRTELQDPLKKVKWKNGTPADHVHEIDSTKVQNQELSSLVKFNCGQYGSTTGKEFHDGDKTKTEYALKMSGSIDLDLSIENQNSSATEVKVESKPAADNIPLILYIGKK